MRVLGLAFPHPRTQASNDRLGERQEVIYPWIELSLKGSKCKAGGASYLRLASEGRVMEDSVKCYESLLRQGANRLQG